MMIFIQNSLFVGAVNVSQFLGSKDGILSQNFCKNLCMCVSAIGDVVVVIGIRHIMQNSLKTNHPSMNIFKRFEAVNVPNGPCVWVW